MIFSRKILNSKNYKEALQKGASHFLYLFVEKSFHPPIEGKIQFIDAHEYYIEAEHELYDALKEKLNLLEKQVPEVLQYEGFDIKIPLLKQLFWIYFQDNLLVYATRKLSLKNRIPADTSKLKKKKSLKNSLKFGYTLLLDLFQKRNSPQPNSLVDLKEIGIRLNDIDEYNFYKELLEKIGKKRIFSFQFTAKEDSELAKKLKQEKIPHINLSKFILNRKIQLSWSKMLATIRWVEPEFSYHIFKQRTFVINQIFQAKIITAKDYGKVIIENVGEGISEGYVLSMVANSQKKYVCNTQNGAKGDEAINQNTNFNAWFVHDENMQEIVCKSGALTKELVPISGHFMEQQLVNYQTKGVYDYITKQKENIGKKVIAFFSSMIYHAEQMEASQILSLMLEERNDFIVIVRPHPGQPNDYNQLPFFNKKKFFFTQKIVDDNNVSLLDLLSITDIAITFGSMVSFQASLFNVPSISFEKREKSILNYIDDRRMIYHCKSVDAFEEKMNMLIGGPPKSLPKWENKKWAHEIISEWIMERLN